MASVTENRCAQCGQRQDEGGVVAPMLHLAARGLSSTAADVASYHLDCLPYDLAEQHKARHGSRIEAARKGKRGDALRKIPDDIEGGS